MAFLNLNAMDEGKDPNGGGKGMGNGKDDGNGSSSAAPSPRVPFPTTIEGKIARAMQYKEDGNVLFKDGHYKKAVSTYAKVLAFVRGLPGSKRGLNGWSDLAAGIPMGYGGAEERVTPEQDAQSGELEAVVVTNMATCYLKLGEPRKAIEYAEKALVLSPAAWKAFLRIAEAYVLLRNCDHARTALTQALAGAPDAAARTAVAKVREAIVAAEKAEDVKQKAVFKNIFAAKAPAAPASSDSAPTAAEEAPSSSSGKGTEPPSSV